MRFREMIGQRWTAPCARDAGLRINDDRMRLREVLSEQRSQLENGRSRVAARRRNERRFRDRLSMEFGKSVHGLLEQIDMRVRRLIPTFVGIGIFQPIVRAQIDDEFSGGHASRNRCQRFCVR